MCWNGHEDFQSYSPGRVSARNCLMWNERMATAPTTKRTDARRTTVPSFMVVTSPRTT